DRPSGATQQPWAQWVFRPTREHTQTVPPQQHFRDPGQHSPQSLRLNEHEEDAAIQMISRLAPPIPVISPRPTAIQRCAVSAWIFGRLEESGRTGPGGAVFPIAPRQ